MQNSWNSSDWTIRKGGRPSSYKTCSEFSTNNANWISMRNLGTTCLRREACYFQTLAVSLQESLSLFKLEVPPTTELLTQVNPFPQRSSHSSKSPPVASTPHRLVGFDCFPATGVLPEKFQCKHSDWLFFGHRHSQSPLFEKAHLTSGPLNIRPTQPQAHSTSGPLNIRPTQH